MRILVADDDRAVCELVQRWLVHEGHEVTVAFDGLEACEVAESLAPDLLVLDLLLPRRDGYAVMLHLRGRQATANTPIIMLSGEPRSEHARTAFTLGARAFFEKPLARDAFLAEVASSTPATSAGTQP